MPRKKPISKKAKPAKREGPSRAAKIDRWEPDYLTTNPKSALVESDLIGLLATPEIWAQMTKEELEHISQLFPDHIPRNENGSISLDWLRYDNDWRHGIRQWQADLGSGHLEPKWQREAALAMEERAAGNFDKFKEAEFEEFWGQKQKMPWDMLAGQSSTLKLPDLITANLFKEGDFWVYSRFFVQGKAKIHVVKDCKIIQVGENSLTFTIPPGTLRYARRASLDASMEKDGLVGDTTMSVLSNRRGISKGTLAMESIVGKATTNGGGTEEGIVREEDASEVNTGTVAQGEIVGMKAAGEKTVEENSGSISSRWTEGLDGYTIFNVQMLVGKILKLDGRIKNPSQKNSWKSFRCQRNNQDMGSLFEIREQYYVWKYPH